MAGISVRGNTSIGDELVHAAEFFLSRLVSPGLLRRLDIDICVQIMRAYNDPTIGKNGRKYFKKSTDWGSTQITDENTKRPRKFLVRLSDKNRRTFQLKILAHELVHVAQHATKKLGAVYKGKKNEFIWWENCWINEKKTPYMEHPWEIEAFRRSKNLVDAYRRHLKKGESNGQGRTCG